MTQLELAGRIGSDLLSVVWVYAKGQMTLEEMARLLGQDKTEEVKKYMISTTGQA